MMHELYGFLRGPMLWVALLVFFGGSGYRVAAMWRLARKKDAVIFNYSSGYYALRSIFHWLLPFGSRNMRNHPVMTVVAFVFHICLFLVPLFLSAHIILIKESWNVSWPWLPDHAADAMTWMVVAGCGFFAARRIIQPDVRYLTSTSDYLILAAIAVPFVSGTWAFHQWPAFPAATLVHMASAEILLMIIPFTRLSHMLFFPFTRGYMGSEFGAVRKARDW